MPLTQQLGDYCRDNKGKVGGTVSIGLLGLLFTLFVTQQSFNTYQQACHEMSARDWRELQTDLAEIRKELDRCVKVERHYTRTNQTMRVSP